MKFNRRMRILWMLIVMMVVAAGCGGAPASGGVSAAPAASPSTAAVEITPTPTPVPVVPQEPEASDAQASDEGGGPEASDGETDEGEAELAASYGNEEALFAALNIKIPDQLYYEMTSTGVDGTVSHMIYYKKGENFRIEGQENGADLVTIYNAKEGMTYSYDRNEGTGMSFADEDEAGDLNNDDDEIAFSDEDMVIANVSYDRYDGERVIYYEMQGEGVTGKVWFSLKYGIPLRSESTYAEGTLISEVTRVDAGQRFDDSLFKPEEGIQFMDMDDLFNQFDMAGELMQME